MKFPAPFFLVLCLLIRPALDAQQHNSVPLDSDVYAVIESAVLRGLVPLPSSAKPWPFGQVKDMLVEILNAGISERENGIVRSLLESFERREGLSYGEGRYYSEKFLNNGTRFSFEGGLNWQSGFSFRVPSPALGTVNMGTLYIGGDMGSYLSWNFNVKGGILYADRDMLGYRPNPPYIDTKYGRPIDPYGGPPYIDSRPPNNPIDHIYYYDIPSQSYSVVYDIPAWFPGTFTKQWEGAVFPPADLGGYHSWPDSFAFGYEIISEVNASFFDRRLGFRFGRMRRDWGPEGNGASLVLNAMARPFVAVEGSALVTKWMNFSFLTGALEYMKMNNQWMDAEPFQNLFTIAMLELNPGKFIHIDFGSATVWPKRFDLGYFFPVNSNFFYQNNVGDFDNLALFGDLEIRVPGKFKVWGSLYLDEARFDMGLGSFLHLDRNMYAIQGGTKINIPWLPFASLTVRYTKVEPYCYTHEYTETPWNRVPVDTAYINNGESLGIYLPPNSDEALLRLEAMLFSGTKIHAQYQMIRHGADWGSGRVDGSSLGDKIYKDANTEKSFLEDGVYQWRHVFKIGGTYSLKTRKIPVSLFAETGIVVTRYTKGGQTTFDPATGYVVREEQGGYTSYSSPEYLPRTDFLMSIGFKVFP
ncbi:MAG: hypothetical protein LBG42_00740 [Treponema sp.]|jgi:hypothetical protein|nr:hypothetical protein [Treponema sp.]